MVDSEIINQEEKSKAKGKGWKRKFYLVAALLLALAVSTGSFAYTQLTATVTPTTKFAGVDGGFATVSTTEPISGSTYATGNASPSWEPIEDVAGAIIAGDLTEGDVFIKPSVTGKTTLYILASI